MIIRLLNHSQPRQIALSRVSLAESCVFPPSSSRRIGERGLNYRKKLQQVSRVMDGVIWLICLAICVDDDFCLGFYREQIVDFVENWIDFDLSFQSRF